METCVYQDLKGTHNFLGLILEFTLLELIVDKFRIGNTVQITL